VFFLKAEAHGVEEREASGRREQVVERNVRT